jgi:CheY-like chemotaxis protein
VEQVLEYSRQQDISREALYLTPLVRESLETFRLSLAPSIQLDTRLTADQECVAVNAAQIQQVMMNLLQNAAQAMPKGGVITVTLKCGADRHALPKGIPADCLCLTVSDTGGGIPNDAVERIFEPFFTTKRSRGGTGMGLAVVYSIVTGSGGTITVDSAPGTGTTFTVLLPRVPPPAAAPTDEGCFIHGACRTLLLVDDDSGALSAMARTLRNANFEVETAKSGEAGLKAFSRDPSRFGLVLADQSMPGMNGIDMATRMLAIDNRAIVVICTGHVEPALEKQARGKGVVDFAIKPLAPQSLVKMVRKYCP